MAQAFRLEISVGNFKGAVGMHGLAESFYGPVIIGIEVVLEQLAAAMPHRKVSYDSSI